MMSSTPPPQSGSPFLHYLKATRSPLYSALFALPLFLIYEAAAFAFRQDMDHIRNGADVLLKQTLSLLGIGGLLHVSLVMLVGLIIVIWINRHQATGPVRRHYFVYMLGESLIYAVGLGMAVSYIVQSILLGPTAMNLSAQIILSLGAGIYEELIFRVILVTALFWTLHSLCRVSSVPAYAMSAVLAALVFSGFHYIGPLGDVWTWSSFLFRFIAGLVLSGLYITRGYGITAYAHALYDLLVTFKAL